MPTPGSISLCRGCARISRCCPARPRPMARRPGRFMIRCATAISASGDPASSSWRAPARAGGCWRRSPTKPPSRPAPANSSSSSAFSPATPCCAATIRRRPRRWPGWRSRPSRRGWSGCCTTTSSCGFRCSGPTASSAAVCPGSGRYGTGACRWPCWRWAASGWCWRCASGTSSFTPSSISSPWKGRWPSRSPSPGSRPATSWATP